MLAMVALARRAYAPRVAARLKRTRPIWSHQSRNFFCALALATREIIVVTEALLRDPLELFARLVAHLAVLVDERVDEHSRR